MDHDGLSNDSSNELEVGQARLSAETAQHFRTTRCPRFGSR
jgi:hypothetical protein